MQYPGSPLIAAKLRVVGKWATRRRRAEKADTSSLQRVPSARTIARLMTARRDHLSKAETVTIAAIEQGVPTLVTARSLITDFQTIIRTKAIPNCQPGSAKQAPASRRPSHPASSMTRKPSVRQ